MASRGFQRRSWLTNSQGRASGKASHPPQGGKVKRWERLRRMEFPSIEGKLPQTTSTRCFRHHKLQPKRESAVLPQVLVSH